MHANGKTTRLPLLTLASIVLLLPGVVFMTALAQQPSSATNSITLSPVKTTTYDSPKPTGATEPSFSHGYLVQFQRRTSTAGQTNIYIWNSSGQLEHQVSVWPTGATKLFLSSVDVGANMRLGFAGIATRLDGSKFYFIATSQIDGSDPQYSDTGRYLATKISLADDGSIWAVGAERFEATDGDPKTWKNYDILRRYSSTGALLAHFLPRWSPDVAYVASTTDSMGHVTDVPHNAQGGTNVVNKNPNMLLGYANAWKPGREIYLCSSGPKTFLYDALYSVLYIYDAQSDRFAQWSLFGAGPTGFTKTNGVAETLDGTVFASMYSPRDQQSGLFSLNLLSKDYTAQWKPVPGTIASMSSNGAVQMLLGADQNLLVYKIVTNAPATGTTVVWSTTQ